MKSKKLSLVLMLSFLSLFAGCGGGGGGDSGGSSDAGTLSLSLTDDADDGYKAVYVTIEKVEVHMGGDSWTTVSDVGNNRTYNLLELVGGVREELGITDLASGPYSQMRLILGRNPDDGINILSTRHPHANYVITDTDEIHELKIPSGFQTGIKIVQGFEINANTTTEILLDFQVSKSIVKAGSSGNWLLKPTIKVSLVEDHAIVRGVVIDGTSLVQRALVSAQQFDDNDTQSDKTDDTLKVFSTTLTDSEGHFALFLNPQGDVTGNLYNIVAYKNDYEANCVEVLTSAGLNQGKDATIISLAKPVTTGTQKSGTLTGKVAIPGATSNQFVELSLRQNKKCRDAVDSTKSNDSYVEVKSENHANLSPLPYTIVLTRGSYDVHASIYDEEADQLSEDDIYNISITEGGSTLLNVP